MADDRPLTAFERAALSPGLLQALDAAGAEPRLVPRAHPGARIAALWRGSTPILTRRERVFWPGVPADLGGAGEGALALLQHELQHVLDYATGALSAAGYLLKPANWRYRYGLHAGSVWSDFAAEQRASIAEHYWLLEHGRDDLVRRALNAEPAPIGDYRRVIPWL